MPNAGLLSHDQILKLQAAVISAGLTKSRNALLAGIDPAFVAGLSDEGAPGTQILADLDALNAAGELGDGTAPLATWLKNAVTLAGTRKEAAVFQRALNKVQTTSSVTAPTTPSPPKRSVPQGRVARTPETPTSAATPAPSVAAQERTEPFTLADKPRLKAELKGALAKEIENCRRVQSTVESSQWRILEAVLWLATCGPDGDWCSKWRPRRWVALPDLLMHMQRPERLLRDDLENLIGLGYLAASDEGFRISGHANALGAFARAVIERTISVEGDEEIVAELIHELLP